jgi:hypothetical protein
MSDADARQPAEGLQDAARSAATFEKQAVVVIHGMGEQMPMDTIKSFVRTVWQTDKSLFANQERGTPPDDPSEVWSKPDLRTGSLELRRITTRPTKPTPSSAKGARCDFYELYWADLSGGSTWQQVEDWIVGLLCRSPFSRVPRDVFLAWALLWAVSICVALLSLATALPKEPLAFGFNLWRIPVLAWFEHWQTWQLAAITTVFGFVTNWFVVPYFGRVVRYTRAKPENIAARTAIRERGLKLLADLHDGEYDRIVLVGHSLGSILAYDLLSYFWAARTDSHTVEPGTPEFFALCHLERVAARRPEPPTRHWVDDYLAAQKAFGETLRARPKPAKGAVDTRWLITDLITLGSPLGHAEFLLAQSATDLERRKNAREFPTSPPVREALEPGMVARAQGVGLPVTSASRNLFCFPFNQDRRWQLHHAAPFAATRWTNIHDPARLVFCGDIISSPVAPVLGPAVVDVDLRALRRSRGLRAQSWRFTHTLYWSWNEKRNPPQRILALRIALALAR